MFLDPNPQPFAQFNIVPGVEATYAIDWTQYLANYWAPGALVGLNEVVRPYPANGYQYICTAAGQSSTTPPVWPIVVGGAVLDGSATWTCEAVDNTSLLTTVASATWAVSPSGALTASGQTQIQQTTPVLINASAALSGTTYDVTCTATLANGNEWVGTLQFVVH